MENPGCVTFRDDFLSPSAVTRAERQLRAIVIAHEMAHMWFGDLVTMRWWNDVWLSESFAEYMGFRVLADATAFTGTWTVFALARKTRGYDADQRASAHPVAPEPPEVPDTDAARASYDGISYAKGASALRQLVAWLGWPAFLAGINDYFARYRFGCATLADLLDCLSRAAGTDVGEWAGPWLRSAGVDTLTVSRPEPPGRVGCISHAGGRPHRVWIGVYDEGPGRAHAPRPGPGAGAGRCGRGRAARRRGPARARPAAAERRRLQLLQDQARSASRRTPWPPRSAACPIRSAAPWPGTASVTWSGTASSRRGSTSPWPRVTCPPRPTTPSPGT